MLAAGRVPVVAMLVGPGYLELVHEIAGLPRGRGSGSCARRSAARTTCSRRSRCRARGRRDRLGAHRRATDDLELIDRTADLILMSREALAAGLDRTVLASGAHPAVDLRVRPVRARAAPPRGRARRRRTSAAEAAPRLTAAPPGRAILRSMREFHVQRAARERYGIDGRAVRRSRRPRRRRPRGDPPAGGATRIERGGRGARRLGRRHRRPRAAPRDRPSPRRPLRGRASARGAMAEALDGLEDAARARRRTMLLDRFARGVPGRPATTRAAAGPPRGAAADPGRQREPGRRAAARAHRRPRRSSARRATATRSAGSRRVFAAGPPIGAGRRLAHRAAADPGPTGADVAGRPAALHPRALGRAPGRRAASTSSPGWTWRSASSPRRSGPPPPLRRRPGREARPRRRRSRVRRDEPEAFSSDSAWMPQRRADGQEHVRLARPAVAQLRPRRSGTLDAIPDEELDTLAALGRHRAVADRAVGALEGVGARSSGCAATPTRSRRPTRSTTTGSPRTSAARRPTPTCATAAWARGIRLASDMVPNHMGIDSRWVIEHPEWFLSLRGAALSRPTRFNGPDLSTDDRVAIVLEDHYWNDSDAAVVFKRVDRWSGDDALHLPRQRRHELPVERHGPARLPQGRGPRAGHPDDPGRRAAVPDHPLRRRDGPGQEAHPAAVVAGAGPGRRDPVARRARDDEGRVRRADAGRVLARGRRPRRRRGARTRCCWPRRSGCSRATSSGRWACIASTTARSCTCCATRTARATGRSSSETLEFDPEILKRYVNFMSNPDEETAVEQFGKGDKYFGVATVMATLPGLPMLGHGQVEGFGEKYGMEFRRATLDEQPDPWLVERHEREIFPLLHRRAWFAEAHDFLLYDFVTDGGAVDEDVFAYSNGGGPTRSLVAVPRPVRRRRAATIRESAAVRPKNASGAKRLVRRDRSRRASACRTTPAAFVAFRDARTGLESIRSCRRDPGARPARRARRVRGPRLLGVPRGPRRQRRPVGAAGASGSASRRCRRSTTRCASCSSSRSTSPLRAIFDGGLVRGGAGPAPADAARPRRARGAVRARS